MIATETGQFRLLTNTQNILIIFEMYPKIKFKIDVKTDIENAKSFIKRRKSDKYFLEWFLPKEVQYILNGKFSEKELNKILEAYTIHIHTLRRKEIENDIKSVRGNWAKVEKGYFKLIDRIFNNFLWPRGSYTGFATIYNMYPRNISKRVFFFPYIHNIPNYANYVIAHEMMHFIFFDYINKIYEIRENAEFKNKPQKYVWQISEVFNNVIEDWKEYQNVIKCHRKPRPYPGTEKIFSEMKKQWRKKQDIKGLLNKWFK